MERNVHQSYTSSLSVSDATSIYHKKPALYPAKRKMNNPLRKQGWHTHPDPYIEEGGVYTHKMHPALTDVQGAMRDYTSGDPNHYIAPPSTVMNVSGSTQQKIRITDPLPEKLPPITLPPS